MKQNATNATMKNWRRQTKVVIAPLKSSERLKCKHQVPDLSCPQQDLSMWWLNMSAMQHGILISHPGCVAPRGPGRSWNTNSGQAGSGRIQGSDKQPESRVLRKQTDPAAAGVATVGGGGVNDVRTNQQAAGGIRSHRGSSCTRKLTGSIFTDVNNLQTTMCYEHQHPPLPLHSVFYWLYFKQCMLININKCGSVSQKPNFQQLSHGQMLNGPLKQQ